MLDFGLGEILLLGSVALIVLGPEKLPHAARMAGAWYGKIRRTLASIQAEIEQEVHLAEMKKRMADELEKIQTSTDAVHSDMKDFQRNIVTDAKNLMRPLDNHTQGVAAPITSASGQHYYFHIPASQAKSRIAAAPLLPPKQSSSPQHLDTPPHSTDSTSI